MSSKWRWRGEGRQAGSRPSGVLRMQRSTYTIVDDTADVVVGEAAQKLVVGGVFFLAEKTRVFEKCFTIGDRLLSVSQSAWPVRLLADWAD